MNFQPLLERLTALLQDSRTTLVALLVVGLLNLFALSIVLVSSPTPESAIPLLLTFGLITIIALIIFLIFHLRSSRSDHSTYSLRAADLLAGFYNDPLSRQTSDIPRMHRLILDAAAESLRLEHVIRSIQIADAAYHLPAIDAVHVAIDLISAALRTLSDGERIRISTVHAIPRGRSEAFWWGSPDAQRYIRIQEEGIASQLLDVRRLLLVSDENELMAQDIAPWIEQPKIGIDLRRARLDGVDLDDRKAGDILIMDIVCDDDTRLIARCGLIQRYYDNGSSYFEIALGDGSNRVDKIFKSFETHWRSSQALVVPTESWWDTSEDKPGTKGLLAFANALEKIQRAAKFIVAVDKSDLKGGLSEIERDPPYRAWYRTVNARISELEFKRTYILRRRKLSVETFVKEHLDWYFDGEHPKSHMTLIVVFDDDLDRKVRSLSRSDIEKWFEEHPQLAAHLSTVEAWDRLSWHERYLNALSRDFLVTESMVYDYRSTSAAFDMRNLPDYLLHDSTDAVRDWIGIVDRLADVGLSSIGASRSEFIAQLERGVSI
ncbi:MAG: hypothetical protein ACF8PN_09595 [Phycisphaerales bacterium]